MKSPDIAALVLLDHSYSTGAWLNNARVLDTITETMCALFARLLRGG